MPPSPTGSLPSAQSHGLVALGDDGALRGAVVHRAAEAAADDQAAAFRHILLDDPPIGEVVVAQHVNGRAVHGAVPDGLYGTAADAAGGVDAGDMILTGQRHVVDIAHVVAHHAADGHGIDILAADIHVLNGQVLHLAQVHAYHADAADGIIGMEGDIGDRVSLAVQRALEHAAIVAHVLEVHVARGPPVRSGGVDVRGQHNGLPWVALGAAVVHAGGEGEELFERGNLVRVVLRSASAREDGRLGGREGAQGQRQAQSQQHRDQLFHGSFLPYNDLYVSVEAQNINIRQN